MKMKKNEEKIVTEQFSFIFDYFSTHCNAQPKDWEKSASILQFFLICLSFVATGQVYEFHYGYLMYVSTSLMFYIFSSCASLFSRYRIIRHTNNKLTKWEGKKTNRITESASYSDVSCSTNSYVYICVSRNISS